jgi:exopolyphosphatase/guanosine-5'-triphosphate,3'-diphosphate pyrophosphatase
MSDSPTVSEPPPLPAPVLDDRLLVPVPLGPHPAVETPAATDRLAAIDIGSNSIHMIIVAPDTTGSMRVIDREKEMVRLGRSALGKGKLSRRAIRDGLETLVKMTTLARLKGAGQAVAVATSAVREASNGQDFLERVKAQTGLDVQLLSGEEEGRLIHRSVREVVDLDHGRTVVIDIGGGSTEWIAAEGGEIAAIHSLPLGSLRLAGWLTGAPRRSRRSPNASALAKLRDQIAVELAKHFTGGTGVTGEGAVDLVVATSGTAVCAADLADRLAGRERPMGRGLRQIETAELSRVVGHLSGLSAAEIADLPEVGAPRSESILPGAVLLEELLSRAGVESFYVSDRALREGLVLEALGRPVPEDSRQPELRRRQVERLAQRAPSVWVHHQQTARLAVRLFDLTVFLHGLGQREREWLEHAALLHDLGYVISYRRHHEHSYYLISNAGLDAFDSQEVEIIAHVARFHRGGRPKTKKHPTYAALETWQRKTVKKLAAILRIADALDRTHASRVDELYCSGGKRKVKFEVISEYDVSIELETARERASLFERVFERRVQVRQGLARR